MKHYILDGHVPKCVDLLTWARWVEATVAADDDYRRVAFDRVGEASVSTVFLLSAPVFGPNPPRLFETMIFGGVHNLTQWRYFTWDEAAEGHARALNLVRETTRPEEHAAGKPVP